MAVYLLHFMWGNISPEGQFRFIEFWFYFCDVLRVLVDVSTALRVTNQTQGLTCSRLQRCWCSRGGWGARWGPHHVPHCSSPRRSPCYTSCGSVSLWMQTDRSQQSVAEILLSGCQGYLMAPYLCQLYSALSQSGGQKKPPKSGHVAKLWSKVFYRQLKVF